jgi:hypothetical protein
MVSLADVLKQRKEREERSQRPDVKYFSLKGRKNNSARIRFLQELETDSRNYDSSKGVVLFETEHVSPVDFRRRASCTFDAEGRCFACEMDKQEPFIEDEEGNKRWHPWGQKTNLYVQVYTEEGEVAVLSRPADGTFFDSLYDEYANENDNSLTDVTFKISKGATKTAPWELKKTNQTLELPDVVELLDLEQAVVRHIPYDEQEKFYIPESKAEPKQSPAKVEMPADVDW